MNRTFLIVPILAVLTSCSGRDTGTGGLRVSDVQANMTLPGDTGSVWMEIANESESDDTLLGAEIEGCEAVEIHQMSMIGDVATMQQVERGRIIIPAGGVVVLRQGGLHLMCIGKESALQVGDTVAITLEFARAGPITVTGEVMPP